MTEIQFSVWRTYRSPAAFAIASLVGLVAALIGDGLMDVLGWMLLLMPLLATAYYLLPGPRH